MNTLKFVPDLVTGRLNEYDAKRYFSRFGWFAFTYFVLNSAIQTFIAVIVARLAPTVYGHFLFRELLSIIPSYCISLPIAYMIIRPLPSVNIIKEKMKASHFLCGFCIAAALMTVGNYISNIILTAVMLATGAVSSNPIEQMIESSPVWVTVLFVVIIAPILEEIMFRGIICKKLLILGEGYAIILPAAFFALCHGNFYQLFYAFTLGCFFSFIYVKTGKLVYSIIYHMVINLFGSVIAPLVLDFVDYENLLNEGITLNAESLLGLVVFLIYDLVILGATIFGIVVIVKNRKLFKPDTGLLPPPEGRAISCVMLNSGIAAAIALFALTLVGSLIM